MEEIIEKISKVENGFKPIEFEAIQIFKSKPIKDVITLSCELLYNGKYQVRSLVVFLLGYAACKDLKALNILKDEVSKDQSWQVQEILAKSFDQYCKYKGYRESLPTIKDWLKDENPNVCRAVTEGLRIWTSRPYFKENPEIAVKLISDKKSCDSEYLRKSVGNALRDISKKHNELVAKEISGWDLDDKKIAFTYRYVVKNKKKI